jgi:hypothetical protein
MQADIFVNKLVNAFVDICLLRAGPQDLPASGFLLVLTAVLGVITGTVVLYDSFGDAGQALMAQLLDLAFMLLFLRLGLSYRRKEARLLQSATAVFGSGVVMNLVSMPVQLLIGNDPAGSVLGELGVLLYLFLLVWVIVVIAHILRHAFEIKFVAGSLLAIGYFLLINWLVQLFFPVA